MTTFKKWRIAALATLALGLPLTGLSAASARAAQTTALASNVDEDVYILYWQEPISLQWLEYGRYTDRDEAEEKQADLERAGYETIIGVANDR
jgi:hypothetical protein